MQRRVFLKMTGLTWAIGQNLESAVADTLNPDEVRDKLRQAVLFFKSKVARHGGYVYRYSADLQKAEGEGETGPDTIWVQPPGTPSVGQAMLEIYQKTGLNEALEAAIAAGHALAQGQLHSGCWNDKIEFASAMRKKIAYRVDGKLRPRAFNVSTFDDDKTQSAVRFLVQLNRELEQKDPAIKESVAVAIAAILAAQFPNGGFAQGFSEPADQSKPKDLKASYPETWPRTYPGGKYWFNYTFNDGNISSLIETLLLASRFENNDKLRDAAQRAGEFILAAQMPDPQPAWAQQYDDDMKPVWARKFEPPAISGGESQSIIASLMDLYLETGDARFLKPIPPALAWFEKSALPDGSLARFYELKTNRPLYFNRKYELTYEPNDLPTHYGFIVPNKSDNLKKRYEKIASMTDSQRIKERDSKRLPRRSAAPNDNAIQNLIQALDARGAWVEEGRMKYYPKTDPTRQIIDSSRFIKNTTLMADWLAAKNRKSK